MPSQSMLDAHTAQAADIAALGWWMLGLFTVVLFAVLWLLALALLRGWRGGAPLDPRTAWWLVAGGGALVPFVVAVVLVIASVRVGERVIANVPQAALTIEVIGRQWWWEVRYVDSDGQLSAVTANEIHLPVGEPVRFRLGSADVIHSFWVPNLQGKIDMIPGTRTHSWFEVDRPGRFRGQCAEFCGLQHALMAFEVVATPRPQFERWLAGQRAPAAVPQDRLRVRGLQVFFEVGCADCHTIRGTPADGQSGPDLTHLASRRTLAAATLPNTRGHLGGWISDPQSSKPGNLMPSTLMSPEQQHALLAYLQGLD